MATAQSISYKGCSIECSPEDTEQRKFRVYDYKNWLLGRYATVSDAKRAIDIKRSNVCRLQSFQVVL
jgi:hypothetical protein